MSATTADVLFAASSSLPTSQTVQELLEGLDHVRRWIEQPLRLKPVHQCLALAGPNDEMFDFLLGSIIASLERRLQDAVRPG